MTDTTNRERLMLRVERSADIATRALDALIRDLTEQKENVRLWSLGQPADTPKVYGNNLGGAADAVADFRATVQTTFHALELFEQEN